MTKIITITGATDGIGLETAKMLASQNHTLLLHGRNAEKLADAAETVSSIPGAGDIRTYRADLPDLGEVASLAGAIMADFSAIDVLINNAGVFKTSEPLTADGYDVRFVVNAIAPYVLTRSLLAHFNAGGRVINLSSAAQAPVNIEDFLAKRPFSDSTAYAQSKLALTMWSHELARKTGPKGPAIIAVNPASFLGSKMVRQAYGQAGHDLRIGADILMRAALSDEFTGASGRYYDNDRKAFAPPHPDALDAEKNKLLIETLERFVA